MPWAPKALIRHCLGFHVPGDKLSLGAPTRPVTRGAKPLQKIPPPLWKNVLDIVQIYWT